MTRLSSRAMRLRASSLASRILSPQVLLLCCLAVLILRPSRPLSTDIDLSPILDRLAVLEDRVSSLTCQPSSAPGAALSAEPMAMAPGAEDEVKVIKSAPRSWRYAVVRGEPVVLLPSGRMLARGCLSAHGVIDCVCPDGVIIRGGTVLTFGVDYNDG